MLYSSDPIVDQLTSCMSRRLNSFLPAPSAVTSHTAGVSCRALSERRQQRPSLSLPFLCVRAATTHNTNPTMPAAKKARSTRHSGDEAPPADDALAEIEDEVAANEGEDEMNQADSLEPHVEVTLDMNAEAGEASAAAGSKRKLGDDGTPHVPLEAPPTTEVRSPPRTRPS